LISGHTNCVTFVNPILLLGRKSVHVSGGSLTWYDDR
jgi:hypothetical protein